MQKHLFANTTYTQPTAIMDIIELYVTWTKNNIDNRTYREDISLDINHIEFIEEFLIESTYMLTSKVTIDPISPAIVLLESKSTDSKVEMIRDNSDTTYLGLDQSIRIMAGGSIGGDSENSQVSGIDWEEACNSFKNSFYVTTTNSWRIFDQIRGLMIHTTGDPLIGYTTKMRNSSGIVSAEGTTVSFEQSDLEPMYKDFIRTVPKFQSYLEQYFHT